MSRKRIIRQRIWNDEKAEASRVGENLRDVQSAFEDVPKFRQLDLDNQTYTSDGLNFSHPTNPSAVLCIHTQKLEGGLQATSVQGDFTYDGSRVTVTYTGLTNGQRYQLIRLLVIG